jgi:AcrR family transcriptional regulator
MKVSSDPRAARTREAIVTAMHELTAAGDVPLTVSAVVSKAGISRSAFYAQFASLDELALAVLRSALAEMAAAGELLRATTEVTGAAAARAGFGRLVAHVDENRVLYLSVLDRPVSHGVYREAAEALAALLREAIPLVAERDGHVENAVAASYIASGTIAVLGSWLRDRPSDATEAVTEQLVALLPGWLVAPPAEPASAKRVTRRRAR